MFSGVCVVTFGLDLLQVGRDDDALDLLQLQMLADLPQTQHHAPLALSLVHNTCTPYGSMKKGTPYGSDPAPHAACP